MYERIGISTRRFNNETAVALSKYETPCLHTDNVQTARQLNHTSKYFEKNLLRSKTQETKLKIVHHYAVQEGRVNELKVT